MSGCRSEAGRLFQILRPATEKLLSPSRVFVLRTVVEYVVKTVIDVIKLMRQVELCMWYSVQSVRSKEEKEVLDHFAGVVIVHLA